MICEVCLRGIPERLSRGPLIGMTHPARIYYKGKPLPVIGHQAEMLLHLMRFGRSSIEALSNVATGEDTNDAAGSVRRQILFVRKKLPPSVSIASIRGWGYELVIA